MRTTKNLPRTVRTAVRSGAVPALAAALAVGTLIVCGLIDGGLIADAADGGADGFQMSAAAQRGALAYWTATRMSAIAPKGIPTAEKFGGVPRVGALFSTTGGKGHFCTASVVDSAAGDLVITAAHCVYDKSGGYATNVEYVPGYHDGERPYGAWAVRKITVASGWRQSQNPNLDVAFLAVGPAGGARIQARTGGLTLGTGRGYAEAIEPIGYNNTDDEPVRCQTHSFKSQAAQLEFYCHGFWNGTSGGPWIAGFNARTGTGTLIGVIGGYEQGGDYDWASYSPYFGSAVRSLFQQAGGGSGALQDLRAVHLAEGIGEEFQAHAVRVAEVYGRTADLLVRHTRGVQLAAQVVPLLLRHRDRDVVDVAEGLLVRAEIQAREVEERQQVPVAHVEEEVVRPLVVPVPEDLRQRELQDALVELDRLLHVRADQRRVVDAPR
jgi:V8-like Glu-specific endopeptidase